MPSLSVVSKIPFSWDSHDESGAIYDPRDKRKMNCDLIEVSYQNNQMESNLIPQSECLSDEEISMQEKYYLIVVEIL